MHAMRGTVRVGACCATPVAPHWVCTLPSLPLTAIACLAPSVQLVWPKHAHHTICLQHAPQACAYTLSKALLSTARWALRYEHGAAATAR